MGKMRIAVVDDDANDRSRLKEYIYRYFQGKEDAFEVRQFENGMDFLEQFQGNIDIVFMDIEMPHLDGITTAKKMRLLDRDVILIYITNMAQFAIRGYEVNAIEFMIKPVGYYNFTDKLEKAMAFLHRNAEKSIVLHQEDSILKMSASDIYYMEKDRNYVMLHTSKGVFRERGTIADMEKKLEGAGFSKCNSGCLVNLKHVSQISKDVVVVGQQLLPLSRQQKKIFVQRFVELLEGAS